MVVRRHVTHPGGWARDATGMAKLGCEWSTFQGHRGKGGEGVSLEANYDDACSARPASLADSTTPCSLDQVEGRRRALGCPGPCRRSPLVASRPRRLPGLPLGRRPRRNAALATTVAHPAGPAHRRGCLVRADRQPSAGRCCREGIHWHPLALSRLPRALVSAGIPSTRGLAVAGSTAAREDNPGPEALAQRDGRLPRLASPVGGGRKRSRRQSAPRDEGLPPPPPPGPLRSWPSPSHGCTCLPRKASMPR